MPTERQLFRNRQVAIAVLWPSFLVAGVVTIVFFVFFDPWTLDVPPPLDSLSRMGAYSVGFFIFWLLTASSSFLSCYFYRTNLINKYRRQRSR